MALRAHSIAFEAGTGIADRLELWGGFVREHIGWLEADTFGDPQFDGRLDLGEHRNLKICGIAASRHRVVRTPRLIRRDDRGYVKIVAQIEGAARFEQGGRQVVITPGEWGIYDTTQTYVVSNSDRILQAAILLPRDELTRLGLEVERVAVRRFDRSSPAGRMVYDLLVQAYAGLRQGTKAPGADYGERLADGVARMAHVLEGDAEEGSRLKQRVLQFVAENLRDPGLSIEAIAADFGYSKRYLHKLFENEPTTLSELIWQRRLEHVRGALGDAGLRHRTITDIAFDWGFNSSSHFSRLFHQRFGLSPRKFRALAHEGGRL
ncbi:helix-turn-helix domain-containing protein [Ferrovibrio sp. MS7]|uniref:helix-turn-helix domain-containing protein n=1 Tax=Ferrovibrio plantarum TaxID=3119164 RepID=UPI0031364F25